MDFNIIFLANSINVVGVVLLLMSYYFISNANEKKGFLSSIYAGIIISIGSYLLDSYPVLFLNLVWSVISYYGYVTFDDKKNLNRKYIDKKIFILLFIISIIILSIFFFNRSADMLAYYISFLYIFIYCLLASNFVKKESYLLWTVIGFFFLMPHLLEKMQYIIFINEICILIISFVGLYKSYKNSVYKQQKGCV